MKRIQFTVDESDELFIEFLNSLKRHGKKYAFSIIITHYLKNKDNPIFSEINHVINRFLKEDVPVINDQKSKEDVPVINDDQESKDDIPVINDDQESKEKLDPKKKEIIKKNLEKLKQKKQNKEKKNKENTSYKDKLKGFSKDVF